MPHNLSFKVLLGIFCDGRSVKLFPRGEPLLAHEENVDEALQIDGEDEDRLRTSQHLALLVLKHETGLHDQEGCTANND